MSLAQIRIKLQKQPFRGVPRKGCSENMQQIYMRTPMPKCDFSKVAKKLIEIELRHGCFPVNLLHIFGTLFPKDTFGGMLLKLKTLNLGVILRKFDFDDFESCVILIERVLMKKKPCSQKNFMNLEVGEGIQEINSTFEQNWNILIG